MLWQALTVTSSVALGLSGFVGNLFAIVIPISDKHILSNKLTEYGLYIALAAVDLLTCATAIPAFISIVIIGPGPKLIEPCKIYLPSVAMSLMLNSSLLTAISAQRYLKVVKPFFVPRSRTFGLLLAVISIEAFVWGWFFWQVGIDAQTDKPEFCFSYLAPALRNTYFMRLILALLLTVYFYIVILKRARRVSVSPQTDSSASTHPAISQPRVRPQPHRSVVTCLLLVSVYVLSLILPFSLKFVLYQPSIKPANYLDIDNFLMVLSFIENAANPIIYCFRSKRFRGQLKVLLTCCPRQGGPRRQSGIFHI